MKSPFKITYFHDQSNTFSKLTNINISISKHIIHTWKNNVLSQLPDAQTFWKWIFVPPEIIKSQVGAKISSFTKTSNWKTPQVFLIKFFQQLLDHSGLTNHVPAEKKVMMVKNCLICRFCIFYCHLFSD